MPKLALQANPCYNIEVIKYCVPLQCRTDVRTINTRSIQRRELHLLGDVTMDNLYPFPPDDNTPDKQCAACLNFLPATPEFFRKRSDGLYGVRGICKQCEKAGNHAVKTGTRTDGMKQCTRCEQDKPATIDFFTRCKRSPDGLDYLCKECVHTDWRAKHPLPPQDEIPEGHKKCSKCKHVMPASPRYWHVNNGRFQSHCKRCRSIAPPKEEVPEGKKQCTKCEGIYDATSKFFDRCKDAKKSGLRPICKVCQRKRDKVYRNKYSKKIQKYRDEHKEEKRLQNKRYWRTERGAISQKAGRHNRRARKKSIAGTHTPQQIQEQLKRQKYRCYYAACGHAKFEKANGKYQYHIDHTYPISRVVGTDIPANSIDYLVLTCPSCNTRKGNKFPWEFPEGGRLF